MYGKFCFFVNASSLIDSNDPGASQDSAVSLPAYIGDISLADNTGSMWSGNGNFGQIEDPNDPNNALTNTPVIANGPDPYVFTMTRSMAAAFRLTVICATGDGQVPTWTITMDDGSGAKTRTIKALASPNIVYQMFEIPAGGTPITVSVEADVVDGLRALRLTTSRAIELLFQRYVVLLAKAVLGYGYTIS